MQGRRFGQRVGLWSVGAGAVLMVLQACGGVAVEVEGDDDAKAGSLGTGATDSGASSPGGPIISMPGRPPTVGGTTNGGRSGASTGGRAVIVEGGASHAGGAVFVGGAFSVGGESSFCDGGASPGCDFGRPCQRNADCAGNDCYFPGTGENPICSQRCTSSANCPAGSACTGPFGDSRHCFVLCQETAECQAINSNPINPLECVDMADPNAPQGQTVCAQSSEP